MISDRHGDVVGDVIDVQLRVGPTTDDVTDTQSWCDVTVAVEKSETSESEVSSSQPPHIGAVTNPAVQVMSTCCRLRRSVRGSFVSTALFIFTHISNDSSILFLFSRVQDIIVVMKVPIAFGIHRNLVEAEN